MPSRHQLEPMTLVAIARLDHGAYGVTIHEELERVTGKPVSMAGVYSALDRLERQGLVRTRQSEPQAEPGGRARRLYALSAEGKLELRRQREIAQRLWAGLPEFDRRPR